MLDTAHYGRYLTIAAAGDVAPRGAGADGIAGPSTVTNDRVENFGIVLGGIGASAAFSAYGGGAGIDLAGGGKVINHGAITGGAGGVGAWWVRRKCSFLKKRTKKLLHFDAAQADANQRQVLPAHE